MAEFASCVNSQSLERGTRAGVRLSWFPEPRGVFCFDATFHVEIRASFYLVTGLSRSRPFVLIRFSLHSLWVKRFKLASSGHRTALWRDERAHPPGPSNPRKERFPGGPKGLYRSHFQEGSTNCIQVFAIASWSSIARHHCRFMG